GVFQHARITIQENAPANDAGNSIKPAFVADIGDSPTERNFLFNRVGTHARSGSDRDSHVRARARCGIPARVPFGCCPVKSSQPSSALVCWNPAERRWTLVRVEEVGFAVTPDHGGA